MIFKVKCKRVVSFALFTSMMLLSACTEEEETEALQQHAQAHELAIVAIEIEPSGDFFSRKNSTTQFVAYGLLEDGSRLMNEPDSTGEVSEREINDIVSWSVSDANFANVSATGLFTTLDLEGSVSVFATFSDYSVSVNVVISELVEIVVSGDTEIDVCRDLELSAIGELANGNQIEFDEDGLNWRVEEINISDVTAEFKDQSSGLLSTYLSGDVEIFAEDNSSNKASAAYNINIKNTLRSINFEAPGLANNEINTTSGAVIELTIKGTYTQAEYDITSNTKLELEGADLATIEGNLITINADASSGESFQVIASCNNILVDKGITVRIAD